MIGVYNINSSKGQFCTTTEVKLASNSSISCPDSSLKLG